MSNNSLRMDEPVILSANLSVREAESVSPMAFAMEGSEAHAEFFARLSHELRTPLNSVIGFSRILQKNAAGNQQDRDLRMLEAIRRNGEQVLEVIEGILEFSRLQSGQLELECVHTNTADLAREAVGAFASEAKARNLVLSIDAPALACAVADGKRLMIVFHKVLENAMKFTTRGFVTVRVTTTSAASNAVKCITVTDSGAGISSDRIDQIFDPFFLGQRMSSRRHGGMNLGLSIARSLCAAMGCTLGVESEIGVGSTFSILFPEGVT